MAETPIAVEIVATPSEFSTGKGAPSEIIAGVGQVPTGTSVDSEKATFEEDLLALLGVDFPENDRPPGP